LGSVEVPSGPLDVCGVAVRSSPDGDGLGVARVVVAAGDGVAVGDDDPVTGSRGAAGAEPVDEHADTTATAATRPTAATAHGRRRTTRVTGLIRRSR
jgi:hypothetical protein